MRSIALVLALFLGLLPAAADAQVMEREDEELAEDGWEFTPDRSRPGNAAAGALALTVGTLWHGAGHALAGDRRSANKLLISEGIALVALTAGIAVRQAGDSSAVARPIGSTLMFGGGSVFFAGWFADVIGSFKGTGADLPQNTSEIRGATLELYFTPLVERGLDVNSFLVLRAPVITRRWVITPNLELSTDLAYRRIGASAGHRVRFGPSDRSYAEFGASGYDEQNTTQGWGRTQLATHTEIGLDLGAIFSHLTGLSWTNRIDLAVDHFFFEHDGGNRFRERNRSIHVPLEMGLGFNADQGVHIGFAYRHRPDTLVGMAGSRVGSFAGRLGILPRNRIGVDVRVEQGAFTRGWFGIHWSLAGPGRQQ
jgi:hypothetical protein